MKYTMTISESVPEIKPSSEDEPMAKTLAKQHAFRDHRVLRGVLTDHERPADAQQMAFQSEPLSIHDPNYPQGLIAQMTQAFTIAMISSQKEKRPRLHQPGPPSDNDPIVLEGPEMEGIVRPVNGSDPVQN